MEMVGERRIAVPRQVVWDALNDPAVLQASIPGCESIERIGEDQFQARVSMRIGPMSIRFGGKVRLENLQPPERYGISGEGSGGAMGFAKGGADVVLTEDGPAATRLAYAARAQIGGKMAQLGARLIDSTAKQVSDQFFTAFAAHVEKAHQTSPLAEPSARPDAVDTVAPTAIPEERAGRSLGQAGSATSVATGRTAFSTRRILYVAGAAVIAVLVYVLL